MWCSECQADVSPSSNAPSSCGRCGSRLRIAGDATIREARDIISRWSSSDMLDRISSLPPIPQMSAAVARSTAASGSAASGSRTAGLKRPSEAVLPDQFTGDLSRESDDLDSGFSDQHSSEQGFDDEDSQEDFDELLTPIQPQEDENHSVLASLDDLARRANVKPSDSGSPSEAYLKLSEMDRPAHENPAIDTTDLKLHEASIAQHKEAASKPLDAETVLKQLTGNLEELKNSPKPAPQDSENHTIPMDAVQQQAKQAQVEKPMETPIAATQNADAEKPAAPKSLADAPSLSSLLKQSNSGSVGQLAFAIDAQRQQQEQTIKSETAKQKTEAKKSEVAASAAKPDSKLEVRSARAEPSLDQPEHSKQAESEKTAKSLQVESASQLGSGSKQTKNELDSEGGTESGDSPAHLTTSDQVAPKSSATKFSGTQSAENAVNQPILPEREGGADQSDDPPTPADSQRAVQPRKAQRRKQHPRQLKQAASVLDGDDQKGMNTVSRKYRVDNPNPESVEPAMARAQQDAPVGNSNSNSNGRRFRIDGAESMDGMLETADSRVRTQGRSRQRYIDEPHGNAIRGPHFEVVGKKRSNMASLTGQFLAYLGVLGLTVGTAIVIYGHFGGMSEYTPTGWLVT
ncbi:MAG: hypothetical protein ABJZ55_21485, partial [Fuerstiella sp.]